MITIEKILQELIKTRNAFSGSFSIEPVKAQLAKNVKVAFVLKNGSNYRVLIMEADNKMRFELYDLNELEKVWVNQEKHKFRTLIQESAYYLKKGIVRNRKIFNKKPAKSNFRTIPDNEIKEHLMELLT